jgi:hypothetical protein
MSNKKRIWKWVRIILGILIIVGTAWFFYIEFRDNWNTIRSSKIEYDPLMLSGAFVFLCAAYLVNTKAWQNLINLYAQEKKVTFKESLAIVNTSQLTKYLPGKVWSFALQIWWLGQRGFSKSRVFFVNLVAMLSSLMATSVVGLLMLASTGTLFEGYWSWIVVIGCVLAYVLFILLQNDVLRLFIRFYNRVFKKDVAYFKIRPAAFVALQAQYVLAALLFCGGIAMVCPGIGMETDAVTLVRIAGAAMVADVVGFVALMAPGGLGIREGVLFMILDKFALVEFALLLPIATRLLTMCADVLFGALGSVFFKKMKKSS